MFIAAIEFVGPCRFAGWAAVDMPEKGLKRGDPVAKSHPRAWIQFAAVSLSQPLALDTLVPTPAGTRELRDIRVGDEVFDDRGLPVIVARETEVFEGRPCYRLTFDDGTAVVATDTHGWTLDLSKGRSGDMIQETVSTAELADYWSTRSRPRARIPLVGRETPDRDDLLIDPYLLGLWLGDGSKSDAGIACSVADADEQSAIIQATITDPTWEVRRTDRQIREGQECATLFIGRQKGLCPRGHDRLANPANGGLGRGACRRCQQQRTRKNESLDPASLTLHGLLRAEGVLDNKHVPQKYLLAGTEQRRSLLQGLLDSDGGISAATSTVTFTNINRNLIEATKELAESLGYKPRVRDHGTAGWVVQFQPNEGARLFRIERKHLRTRGLGRQMPYRYLRSIERVESVPTKCIGIDTDNHLFQIEGGLLTHNTQNSMKLFKGIFTKECIAEHGIDLGKETIYAYGGQRTIQAVTSSPRSLEGNRPTLVIKNEALTLDTPIPTPAGWKTMGDLRDGDTIFGSDGQPTTVTKAHGVQHGRRVFEVVFNTGDIVKASDGHWWKVRLANNSNCTLHEMTTLEMFEAGRELFPPRLPVTGVEFEPKELPIDPYILGLWLGDGSSWRPTVACSADDIDETLAEVQHLGVSHAKVGGSRGLHIMLSSRDGKGRGVDSVKGHLRALGLLQNKHIPAAYMTASIEQRLALLQGLFDSDGSIRDTGVARFCNANTTLMDQARQLLLSVGYDVKRPTYQVRDPEEWPDRAHWQPMGFLSVVAHAERPLFRLARKAEKMRPGMPDSRVRKIVEIREVASEPVRCISVAAADKLFMAGEDYNVTRNTHHWLANNEGHEMAKVIRRNAAKAKGGAARSLSITNAYEPSEDSVARQEREAYEMMIAGLAANVGIMYDTLEAPKEARLRPRFPDEEEGAEARGVKSIPVEVKERIQRRYLSRILEAVRGGAWWLDIPGLVNEILDPQTKPSEARRFWFNQVTAAEDAWVRPEAVDASISRMAVEARERADRDSKASLEAGWLVHPDEPIVMFFDGSKSDDATGIVGCRLSDGYCFTIGIWQKPAGERGKKWLAPRAAVDQRVDEAFKRFNVVAFWGDPSHTKDETDDSSYWLGMMDKWMRVYKERLQPAFWPVKTGLQTHAVNFDMTGAERQKMFISAAEIVVDEFEQLNDIEEFEPAFEIDGHPALVSHLKNAIQHFHPSGWGTTLMKDARDSPRKIDLAVCLVGARMLRRVVLNGEMEDEDKKPADGAWGEIW